jgi:hypothetical protein
MTVPSLSRARSASRTGWRLTSNFSANSTSTKRSPGWKTSSRIASRILLTKKNGTFSLSSVSLSRLWVDGCMDAKNCTNPASWVSGQRRIQSGRSFTLPKRGHLSICLSECIQFSAAWRTMRAGLPLVKARGLLRMSDNGKGSFNWTQSCNRNSGFPAHLFVQ